MTTRKLTDKGIARVFHPRNFKRVSGSISTHDMVAVTARVVETSEGRVKEIAEMVQGRLTIHAARLSDKAKGMMGEWEVPAEVVAIFIETTTTVRVAKLYN